MSAQRRKETRAWDPLHIKEEPIPLLATDGARTRCGVAGKSRPRAPLSLCNGEEGAGREAARRGPPRPALGSTLTLILVASLFVT